MNEAALEEPVEIPEEAPEEQPPEKAEEQPPELSEVEQIAAGMGWAPKDQWRGAEEDWTDAPTYLKTGPEILKKTLSKQDGELARMRETIERMNRVTERLDKRERDRAASTLQQERHKAIEEGDVERVEQLDAQMRETEPPAEDTRSDPDFDTWQVENDWYNKDVFLTAKANTEIGPTVRQMHPDAVGAEFYKLVAEYTREAYPERFEKPTNPARQRAAATEEPAPMRRQTGKNGYEQLPPEAKAMCDSIVKQGRMSREEYVKEYFGEDA